MGERKVVKAACRNCHGGCSALLTVEDGRLVKITPDPDGPLNKGRMCAKGLSGIELMYHPDRLKYPMRRIGERGEGKWERISWDEAYDEMAAKLQSIIDRYGAEAICVAQGTGRHMFHHVPRFANTLGTPNWIEPGFAQCFFPRVQVGMLCFGASPIADYYGDVKPKCILVWGHNHDVSSAGSECQFLIGDTINDGAKVIVVDPRRTRVAQHADHWLCVRPGADDALALGMLNVIINEDLYDHDFVENWCYGFEQLRERVQQYPPSRVAEITWVPEEDIIAAARTFATTKPATLEWGVGIEHSPNTTQTVRAVALLMAITGNYDIPGGWLEDLGVLPSADHNNHLLSEEQGKKRLGEKDYRILAGNHNPFPSAHIPSVLNAAITGKPYPIKSFLHFGNNGIMSNADAHKTAKALMAAEYNVCMDHFMTPTAELCDLVLPAAMWMEMEEIHCAPDWGHTILVQKQVVRPYDCKSDEEVFCELCERMGLDYGAKKPSDIYDEQLRLAALKYPQLQGVDYEAMKELAYIQIPYEYKKYEKRGRFNTPTGKVELYSTIFEKLGYDPLPYYEELPESPLGSPELAKEFPLVLTTGGRRRYYFCSEGKQVKSFRRAHGFPQVEIHPETAAKHGIADGDMVYIESPRGRIVQKAWVHDGIDPRVVNCEYGWWFPEREGPDHGCYDSNCNVLTTMDGQFDPCMGTYQLRGLLCKIYKAEDCQNADSYSRELREDLRPVDSSSAGIVIDPNKCVLCGDCIHICNNIQSVGALEFVTNSQGTMSVAVDGKKLVDTKCVGCGQCAQVCPAGAIHVKSSTELVLEAIEDENAVVCAQIAPSVRVGLNKQLGLAVDANAIGQLVALLKAIGFDKVYDTAVGADLTVMEESRELLERLEKGEKLPLFTSCCPAWVKFCEENYPEFADNISSCRSPHQMLGAVIRREFGKEPAMAGKRLVNVSVMPCAAKKGEILRPESATEGVQDVDFVLTTVELAGLMEQLGIKAESLQSRETDLPYNTQSGSGVIFGASGGVLEAVLRHLSTGQGEVGKLSIRNADGLRELSLEINGRSIRAAVTSGLRHAADLLERIKSGEADYDVVEVMACPGGCIMGGGQIPMDMFAWGKTYRGRGKGLSMADCAAEISCSAQNAQVSGLYLALSEDERKQLLHRNK